MPDSVVRIKAFFTDLVDAVRYSQNFVQVNENAERDRANIESQLSELEDLQRRIKKAVKEADIDPVFIDGLDESIGSFVAAAVQQPKEKLEAKLRTVEEESVSAGHSERQKALRSLESYLSSAPIHVLEEEIDAEFSEGSYAVTAKYKCDGSIQYEFLLNTANSGLFRRELSFEDMAVKIRIPVRLGKTWLKREPAPGFEKLDQFVLQKAHATKTQIVASFLNNDTNATMNVVFAKSDEESFMSVEYSDSAGKVDVTGEPSLHKYLDVPALKAPMAKLLTSLNELKKEKLRLVSVTCDDVDVLETLDCVRLMQRIMELMSHSNEDMQAIQNLDGVVRAERLKLLGPKAGIVMQALGLRSGERREGESGIGAAPRDFSRKSQSDAESI